VESVSDITFEQRPDLNLGDGSFRTKQWLKATRATRDCCHPARTKKGICVDMHVFVRGVKAKTDHLFLKLMCKMLTTFY